MLVIGVSTSTKAQCIGPYQGFESVPNTIASTAVATMTTAGWQFIGATAATSFVPTNGSVSVPRSGRTYLRSATASPTISPAIVSPNVQTPQTFSFWVRGGNSGVPAGNSYSLYFSDDAKATWVPITNGATNLTGGNGTFSVSSAILPTLPGATATIPMVLVTVTASWPADADGYYFKIEDSRPLSPANTAGSIQIDDISWTSSLGTDNTIIVPTLNTAGTTQPVCTVTVPAPGFIYKYYDNGGASDTYSDGQVNNDVIFTPINPADKVRITFKSFGTTVSQDLFYVYDSNTIGSGGIAGSPFSDNIAIPLASATPVNSYTSTFVDGSIATRFFSDNTYRTGSSNNNVGYEIWVESISNSCADPGVPTLGPITSNSAVLNWTGSASIGYEITYTTSATPPAGAGTPIASPTTTGTLTGLAGNTTYYGWVRAKCGASNFSNWISTATTFTTLCSPVGVPYTENFNGLTAIPTCTSTSGGSWGCNITNGNLFGNSVSQFFFTKPITLSASTVYKLSYDFSAIFGNANFSVYIGTVNNSTMLTTGTLLTNHPSATTSLTNNTLNFTSGAAGTYYIGFYYVSRTTGATQLNLDNIYLDVETCIAPSGVATTTPAPTANAGTVSWTAPSIVPSGGYQYYISTSNSAPTSSSSPGGSVASGTTATISGLTSNTTYYVWVRSSCGGGLTSLWSSSFATFTTAFVVTTTVNMSNGSNGPTPGSCSVNFFDSGGAVGDYVDNETYTYTFYPGTAGSKLKAVFGSFRTENNYDGLMIYSGTTATPGNLISSGLPAGINTGTCPAGSFYGTNSPGTVISTDATGALTFVFTTDGSVIFAGWAATLSCVTVPVISSFTPNNNSCSVGTTTVTITGNNFTAAGGVNGVFFNGVAAASFTVVNNTTLTAVLPSSGVTTGIISVSNPTATGYSSAAFFVNGAKPVTTGVTICTGQSGNLTTSTTCSGYVNSGTTINGNLTVGDPVGPILGTSISNTAVCSYNTGILRNYVGIPFQVSVTGTYTFESSATPAFDSMGYIVRTPYTPGTCSGNWVRGDDDGGAGTFTLISTVLTAGVDYILYTTSWALSSGSITNPFSWAVTPPSGGQIMLPGAPVMNWYVDNTTPTVLGTGNSFNPVGVSGSGLANTNTAATVTYYGACPSNTSCRAATTFVINARPTVSFTAQPGSAACTFSNVTYTTQAGQTNYVWTVPGVLNTDYTIVSGGIGATDNTVTLQWLTTGVKTVTINYNNAAGCPATTAVSSTATTVSASGLSTTVTPSSATICANVPQTLTATSGSANFFTWTTTAGSLFTDAACTVAYVGGTNFATVYFKGLASAIVTASGTVGGTGCAADVNVPVTINKAIWNGTVWSNAGVGPSNTITAEFQGNFTSGTHALATFGDLSACSVIVTSGNVLFNRGTLTVQNTVAVNGGSLTFDDALYDVSLYQPNNVTNGAGVYRGGNTGNITFNRTSAPLFRYDYTYWSTPVHPQNLLAMTPNSPQGLFLDYNNAWNYISGPGSVTMTPAKGYAARAPLNYNLPSGAPPNTPQAYSAPFIGIPNNGNISVGVLGGSNEMNLIGNPYPSALLADSFITANSNLNGALYFWTHSTQSTAPYSYNPADYAIWTLGGGVGTTGQTSGVGTANNNTPTGYIASGQAFFVKGLSNGNANFTNAMRASGNNKNFYRTVFNQGLEKNRYWLNLVSGEGAFKQALVGYIETATMDVDRLFDAEVVEAGNAISLYTKVADSKLSIQGRALPFDIADTVSLIYRSNTATNLTVSIPEYDGLFTSQHVYLEDRVLNLIHDLTEGAYAFATEAGTFEERFILRYTTQALGNPIFNESSVIVYRNANGLFINSGNEMMTKVTVFDIRGRLLAIQKQVNKTSTVFTTLPTTQQVLLVKIEGEKGNVVTKKVVY